MSLQICKHNSRVGHTISTCGYFWAGSINCNKGNPNAAVFPVPVWASPTKSVVPESKMGIAFVCIEVGAVNPSSATAFMRFSFPPPASHSFLPFF